MAKSIIRWMASAMVVLTVCGCQNDDPVKNASDPRGDEYTVSEPAKISDSRAEALAEGQQEFSYALAKELIQPGENFVYSPMSLYNLLAMTANGANGQTRDEIVSALSAKNVDEIVALCRRQIDNFNNIDADYLTAMQELQAAGLDEEGYNYLATNYNEIRTRTSIANGLWVDPKIAVPFPAYVDECQKWLDAPVRNVDFSQPEKTADIVNEHISQVTNGLIPKLLSPDAFTEAQLVMTNALYLDAKWQFGMSESKEPMEFNNLDGSKSSLHFLCSNHCYKYGENSDAQIISIPVGVTMNLNETFFTFTLILPKDSKTPEEVLTSDTSDLIKNASSELIDLAFPLFELDIRPETQILKTGLRSLGMDKAFSLAADFSRMLPVPTCIDAIIHQSVIKVTESGIEAAAASAIEWFTDSNNPNKPTPRIVKVDRPFAFQITDNKTNTILFAGAVYKL